MLASCKMTCPTHKVYSSKAAECTYDISVGDFKLLIDTSNELLMTFPALLSDSD